MHEGADNMMDLSSIAFEFLEYITQQWESYMEEGYNIGEATSQILIQYEDMLDEKERVALYIVLANLQVDLAFIDQRVKDEISKIIAARTADRFFKENKQIKSVLSQVKKCL